MLFEHPNSLTIFGPPGSGKTREVVRILGDHVAAGDFRLPEAAIVSFTRAAAHDIARRVNPDGEPGRHHTTLHALCKRHYSFDGRMADTQIGEFFAAHGIPYRRSRHTASEEWASTEKDTRSPGGVIQGVWSYARNRLISIAQALRDRPPVPEIAYLWVGNRMEQIFVTYRAWKAEEDLYDFDDMLEYAVMHPPRLPLACFVLDEAQDSTPLQWQVAQAFAANAEVAYLAGDDDQAIYSFIGADAQNFLHARTRARDILHVNHRSASEVVAEAEDIIGRNTQRQEKHTVALRDGGSITHVCDLPDLELRSTFVMGRAHYMTDPVMDELEARGYPFADRRGARGVSGNGAVTYYRFVALRHGSISLEELRLFYEAIPSRGPWLMHGAKKLLHDMDREQRRSWHVKLPQLVDFGATEMLVSAIGSGSVEPLSRVSLDRLEYLRRVERNYGEEYLDPRRAAEVCSVGPIHAFKGLEADTVVLMSGMPPAATREAIRDPEPERRVFYVAVSRAKERVIHLSSATPTHWKELI